MVIFKCITHYTQPSFTSSKNFSTLEVHQDTRTGLTQEGRAQFKAHQCPGNVLKAIQLQCFDIHIHEQRHFALEYIQEERSFALEFTSLLLRKSKQQQFHACFTDYSLVNSRDLKAFRL